MPKVGMEPQRRADVINATLTCISNHGIDGMTLDKVAEYAGCSKGVITYYYENKDNLTIEAFKSFMSYYGLKIQSEITLSMTATEMADVTMNYILPPFRDDSDKTINVSQLDGIDKMYIPHEDQARLFLQFFPRAAVNRELQDVVAQGYTADLQGIAKIFDYGKQTGKMKVEDSRDAAYGLLAMTVGLSFFRVVGILPASGTDNRYILEEYARRLTHA